MEKLEIVKSWYPNEALSDDDASRIYERLLQFLLLLYNEDNLTNESEATNESEKK